MNYQWRLNGANIPGATSDSYNIPTASSSNAGGYTLAVSNRVGAIFSREAKLSVVAALPPALAQPGNYLVNAGQPVTFSNSATESNPALTLTFSLDSAPTEASIAPASGVFNWRPPLSAAGTTNQIVVRVTDSGTPSLSDTKTFFISVNALQPSLLKPLLQNGQLHFVLTGAIGPDYVLQGSDDLLKWTALETNSPTFMPFDFIAPRLDSSIHRFYRLRLGP
jgi:hypothetical protein